MLVTGGTGFIGRELVKQLCAGGIDGQNVDVTILTRNARGIPAELDRQCYVMEGDLESLPNRRSEVHAFEYVFHLAAEKDFFGGKQLLADNINGTRALIDALEGSKTLKRVIYASSMGAVDRDPRHPCLTPMNEEAPPFASSAYGKSKYEGERLLAKSSLPYTILRIPWCFGRGMTEITHIRKLSEMVARGSLITRFDWPGRVSIIDVKECARAFVFLAAHPEAAGSTYLVSDGEPISFGALFREMGRMTGAAAGSMSVPGFVQSCARSFRRFIPFTIRCLFVDVLSVDDAKIRGLGFVPAGRAKRFLLPLARYISEQRRPSAHRSSAFVTGAASGIGRALAIQLSASGRNVLLVDRDDAVRLLAAGLPGSEPVVADLCETAGLAQLEKLIALPHVNWVINCAGIGVRGEVGTTDPKGLARLIDVNVAAVTELSDAALRNFQNAGEGTLINICSSVAFQPLAGMAAYSGSKAYVLNFTEAVACEHCDSGITILNVCPGGVNTRFQECAGVKKDPNEKLLTPEAVAAATLKAVAKGRSGTVFVGSRPLLMSLLARCLPRSVNARLWKRLMEKRR